MENVIGNKYGRFTVVRFSHIGKHYAKFYFCKCECGNIKTVRLNKLKYGEIISCGCFLKERLRESNKKRRMPFIERLKNCLYSYFSFEAKRKKRSFFLTKEQCYALSQRPCFYCGKNPSNSGRIIRERSEPKKYKYSGIDRIDNTKGYTLKNAVPCCAHCNKAKRALSKRQFFKMVKRIYETHNLQENKV